MKKVYGITNPKKLDYLFSVLIALVAVSALWVGIWIAATQTYENAKLSFELFGRAIKFDLNTPDYWLILFQSAIMYAGFAFGLTMLIVALVRRKFRATLGAFASAFAGLAISLEIGFIGVYANQPVSEVSGVFSIVLAVLCIATIVFIYLYAKFACKLAIYDKLYDYEFEEYYKGFLKDRQKKISGLSKSETVYDAINDKPKASDPKQSKAKSKPVEEKQPQIVEDEQFEEDEIDDNSPFGIKANHYTFEQKLKMAKPIAKKYFKEIKAYYEEIGFKPALTKSGETFSHKNTKFAVITTAGKSGLKIYFKLSPSSYEDSTLPFKDVSDKKKYEKTPLMFVVKSDLAVRRAKALMDDIKKEIENEQK